MRPRMKIRRGLTASSDMTRVKAYQSMLEEAHKEFINSHSFLAVTSKAAEPSDDTMVFTRVFGRKVQMPYGVVKSAGYTWTYV